MPTRVAVDDDEQQIQDLIKEMRRLRSRLATTAVKGTHDEFTAAATPATTYTLTYIPVTGTCLMALNGHVQREGTDYTCDYTTGIVTVSVTQAASDKLTFRYLVTDWLIARSLTPDTGAAVTDNFNRANSSTALGTTSDGSATWVAQLGTWGISSNQAYQSGTGTDLMATVDAGEPDATLQVTLATISIANSPGVLFRFQDTSHYFMFRAENSTHYVLWRVSGGATQIGSITATVTNGDVLKVALAGSTIKAYLNGTLGVTVTDTAYQTQTKYGLYTSVNDTTSRWDDLTVTVP